MTVAQPIGVRIFVRVRRLPPHAPTAMGTMKYLLLLSCSVAVVPAAFSRSISVNLHSAGGVRIETAQAAGTIPVDGRHWNHVGFPRGNIKGLDGQKEAWLGDDQGNAKVARFTSTLASAYVGLSGASSGQNERGHRALMYSYLSFDRGMDRGHLRCTDLDETFAQIGYDVYVYFDTDNSNRVHTLILKPDNGEARSLQGNDSGTFAGAFVEATGPDPYANMAVFRKLTATAFTLDMDSSTGRAAVNGIQIVSSDHVCPPSIRQFRASRRYLTGTGQVELSWETSGADQVRIQPDVAPISGNSGSTRVGVSTSTAYTLSVSNRGGAASTSLRVRVGPPRPNILFFLVDDMGWQDTSEPFHYDQDDRPVLSDLNKRYRTPSMERLADQAKKFTRAYVSSVCTPTRVSLMTGMNATRHHVTTWTFPNKAQNTGSNQVKHLGDPDWRKAGMDKSDIPLPRLLQDLGYRTIHAGKAHFAPNGTFGGDPCDIGFDVNIAGHGAGLPGSYYGTANFGKGMWHVPGLEKYHGKDIFLTEVLTLEMKDAITQSVNAGQPFFAYMAHYAVHGPFLLDSRFADNYPDLEGRPKAYATLIEGMDKSLGDLMDHLEVLNVAENTLVVFLSDNGGDAPIKNGNAPLRGKKGHRHEGGLRVPLMVGWGRLNPKNVFQKRLSIQSGTRCHKLVAGYDLFPTLINVAGGAVAHRMDGFDLAPYLIGTPGIHRPEEVVTHFPHGHNHDHYTTYHQGDWKVIHNYGDGSYELYNLADDLAETNNLAQASPAKLQAMSKAMARELERNDAQYSVNLKTGKPQRP